MQIYFDQKQLPYLQGLKQFDHNNGQTDIDYLSPNSVQESRQVGRSCNLQIISKTRGFLHKRMIFFNSITINVIQRLPYFSSNPNLVFLTFIIA